jgi:hypothetical protein
MIPFSNSVLCAYWRRKPNVLGDSASYFEAPVFFHARKYSVSKQSLGIGGMMASSSVTYFETRDLNLSNDEMKKADGISIVASDPSKILYGQSRIWIVQSVEIKTGELKIMPKDEDEAERKSPKRMAVQ